MAKAKKKSGVAGIILTGVVLLGLVMAIVGVCIDYVNLTATIPVVGSKTTGYTLMKLTEDLGDVAKDQWPQMLATMKTFAIVTVVMTGVSAVLCLVARVLKIKLFKLLTALAGLVTIVCAIVAIATAYGFCDKNSGGVIFTGDFAPAAGAWLLTIFAVLGGGAAIGSALK